MFLVFFSPFWGLWKIYVRVEGAVSFTVAAKLLEQVVDTNLFSLLLAQAGATHDVVDPSSQMLQFQLKQVPPFEPGLATNEFVGVS